MAWNRNPVGEFRSTDFPKPYFTACAIAYVVGLATTMLVMHMFHAAQPALLYLSPACILSALVTAAVRGELKDLFAYTTAEEEDDKKKDDTKRTESDERHKSPLNDTAASNDVVSNDAVSNDVAPNGVSSNDVKDNTSSEKS